MPSRIIIRTCHAAVLLFALSVSAKQAGADCGEGGGPFTGSCVDLQWRPAQQTASLGEIVEIGLYAVSVNGLTQPVHAIDAVMEWDPLVLEILPNEDPCNELDSCFECPDEDPPTTPATYNWLSSCFPVDSGLDDLNAGCAGGACCSPSGSPTPMAPINDGTAYYRTLKQIFCNAQSAEPAPATPDGLLITNLRFRVLEGGTHSVDLLESAACHDVPAGCTAVHCCNPPECTSCSFADTRVVGGSYGGDETTATIGPPAVIEVLSCSVPQVIVEGSRYMAVTPAQGPESVAIRVTGVSPPVLCVDGYVQPDTRVLEPGPGQQPEDLAVYRPPGPGGWDTVHVRGERLTGAPDDSGSYVYSVRTDCDPDNPGTILSEPVLVTLWRFGDTGGVWGPDATIDFVDITLSVEGFRNLWNTPICCSTDEDCSVYGPLSHCDTTGVGCTIPSVFPGRCLSSYVNLDLKGTMGCTPDMIVDFNDITTSVDAFRHIPDACTMVCP